MSLRPFLCHARRDRGRLEAFSAELSLMGADGWQDVNDLRLGSANEAEIRRVIAEEAGGFIWFGTEHSAASAFIRRVEIPAALARAKRGPFPVVPLFSDLRPGDLPRPRIRVPRWRGSLAALAEHNGVMRDQGEKDGAFWERAAAAYVRHGILARGSSRITVAFSCTAVPDRTAEVAVDWRALFEAGPVIEGAAAERAITAAANLRAALREASIRKVRVTGDLYLPLAVALGFEWRAVSGLALEVVQRVGAGSTVVSTDLLGSAFSVPPNHRLRHGKGPVLVIVSAPEPVDGAAERYAEGIDAEEIITLHAPHLLSESQIGGLARQTARVLARLSDQRREKHLIVRGPMSLGVLIGAAGNAIGPTEIPLWDRARDYLPGLGVGKAVEPARVSTAES